MLPSVGPTVSGSCTARRGGPSYEFACKFVSKKKNGHSKQGTKHHQEDSIDHEDEEEDDEHLQELFGYTSICTGHRSKKDGTIKHFHNQCIENSGIYGLEPGSLFGKHNDRILLGCGCCDDVMMMQDEEDEVDAVNDSKSKKSNKSSSNDLKEEDASYCHHAPICTPDNVDDDSFLAAMQDEKNFIKK